MKKVVDILITQFYSERCKFFWGMENTSASMELGTDHTDFGHSVKTFWVILEVGELLGDPFYIDFARPKIDQILREAYIEENGSWARRFDARGQEGTYYQTRGGSLGVGIPGAMGIQLARPQAEVLAFTGDGGSMYTIQALHTACRLSLPVKMIICNNRRYHLLDQNLEVYWEEQKIPAHQPPDSFSLHSPIDFAGLARSMGVEAVKAETLEEARGAARTLMEARGPFFVNLVM